MPEPAVSRPSRRSARLVRGPPVPVLAGALRLRDIATGILAEMEEKALEGLEGGPRRWIIVLVMKYGRDPDGGVKGSHATREKMDFSLSMRSRSNNSGRTSMQNGSTSRRLSMMLDAKLLKLGHSPTMLPITRGWKMHGRNIMKLVLTSLRK